MKPRFLIDAQLPSALARKLSELGYDSAHVRDLNLEAATDKTIWSTALKLKYTIVTNDDDFIKMRLLKNGPQIVWVRIGNIGRVQLLEKIEKILPQLVLALSNGESVVEVKA